MYEYDTTVKLHHTDAAGVLFFGNYFMLAHDAYEQFMISIGFDFHHIINEAPFLILIVHADADFRQPMHTGDEIQISLQATKIGRTSFALGYKITDKSGDVMAEVSTSHVVVDKESYRPIATPEKLKKELEALM